MTRDQQRVFLAVQFGGVTSVELPYDHGISSPVAWRDTLAGEDVTDIVDELFQLGLVSFGLRKPWLHSSFQLR